MRSYSLQIAPFLQDPRCLTGIGSAQLQDGVCCERGAGRPYCSSDAPQAAVVLVRPPGAIRAFPVGGWQVREGLEGREIRSSRRYRPPFPEYAGYSHVKTKNGGDEAIDKSDELVTYVFRLKQRVGHQWITPQMR